MNRDRQRRYDQKQVQLREHWYLDIGPTKDEWRAMSPDQQAVHKRWYLWYRKRRAMRELLNGSGIASGKPGSITDQKWDKPLGFPSQNVRATIKPASQAGRTRKPSVPTRKK